jgi:integrase
MARVKLTAGRILDFACGPDQRQAFLWDSDTACLAVRATTTVKAYIFQARLANGATVRKTIGRVNDWGIDAARKEARRLQIMVDQGLDPRVVIQEQAEAEQREREAKAAAIQEQAALATRQALLFSVAWQAYLADRHDKWGLRSQHDHIAMSRPAAETPPGVKPVKGGPLAALLPTPLASLTEDDLRAWLIHEASTRPASAALAYRQLRAFLNWCAEQKDYKTIVDPAALLTKKVREAVPPGRTKDDCLQREQLRLWFGEVRKLSDPVIVAYLQTLLLTGARREELAGLTWDGVDFTWKTIVIKDKVDGERIIPLTPYVSSLLAALPRRNRWVFSSLAAASGHLVETRIAHNRALGAAGLPHLTLHGLRRSFNTLSEWVEMPVGVVAQIGGHKPSATAERHYKRRAIDLLRLWHTKLEAWILTEAGIDQPQAETAGPGLRLVK